MLITATPRLNSAELPRMILDAIVFGQEHKASGRIYDLRSVEDIRSIYYEFKSVSDISHIAIDHSSRVAMIVKNDVLNDAAVLEDFLRYYRKMNIDIRLFDSLEPAQMWMHSGTAYR